MRGIVTTPSETPEIKTKDCGTFQFTVTRDGDGKIAMILPHAAKPGSCVACLLEAFTICLGVIVSGRRPGPEKVLEHIIGQGCNGGESCTSLLARQILAILEAEMDEPEPEVEDGQGD